MTTTTLAPKTLGPYDLARDKSGVPIGRWRLKLARKISIPMGAQGAIVDGEGECVAMRAARVLGASRVVELAPADRATLEAIRSRAANLDALRKRGTPWLAMLDDLESEVTQVRKRRAIDVPFDATAGERFRALCEQVLTLNQIVSACRLVGLQGSRATAKGALVDRLCAHYAAAGAFPGDDFDPPDDWASIPAVKAPRKPPIAPPFTPTQNAREPAPVQSGEDVDENGLTAAERAELGG